MPTKTILITGSTSGLGKAAAQLWAQRGYRLLLHGRNEEKGMHLIKELEASTGNNQLAFYPADLASLAEVRRLADHLLAHEPRLDVLVNNAGIGGGPQGVQARETSPDGYELRFAVNYLSQFLLTQLLLPRLSASAPARIIQVSSIAQEPLDFDDLMYEQGYTSYGAYSRSKLAQILFSLELAERMQGTGISVYAMHPATLMDTQMVTTYFGRTMTTVADGVAHLDYVMESPELQHVTGAYLVNRRISTAHAQAYDVHARKLLWDKSMRLCGLE